MITEVYLLLNGKSAHMIVGKEVLMVSFFKIQMDLGKRQQLKSKISLQVMEIVFL